MVKSIDNCGEVAPALLTSSYYYKRPSRCFMLETIIEEEPQVSLGLTKKSVFVSLPVLFSGFFYIFISRGLEIWNSFTYHYTLWSTDTDTDTGPDTDTGHVDTDNNLKKLHNPM
jgi:hypothetical protein